MTDGITSSAVDVVDPSPDARLHAFDWSRTPLGPMEGWSPALLAAVRAQVGASPRPKADGCVIGANVSIEDITERTAAEAALRANEARFRALFEHSMDGVMLTDPNGPILAANPAACRMLGYSEDEIIRMGRDGLIDVTDPRLAVFIAERAATGRARGEVAMIRADGTRMPVDVSSALFTSADGRVLSSMFLRDMTTQRAAEATLRESEARFRVLIDSMENIAVQGYHADGTVCYWNRANEAVYGYTAEEAIGRNLLELIIPLEMRDLVGAAIRDGAETGEMPPAAEMELMRKDGSRVPVFSSHAVVRIPGREPEIFCLDVDITERKAAEAALRESEARYRQVVEETTAIVLRINLAGKIVFANERALRFFGYAAEELLGRPATGTIVPPRDSSGRDLAAMMAGISEDPDQYHDNTNENMRKNGERVWMEWTNSGIYDCEGHLTEFLSVGIDATARRQAEIEREAMLAVLHLLNTPDDLPRLIANLCDFFQQWSGCEAAGIRLRDGDDYPYFETRGFPRAFVHAEKSLCGRLPDGSLARDAHGQVLLECMCGNILSGRTDPALPFFTDFGSFWTNSTTTLLAGTTEAERQTGTRNRCHAAGYESVALIPLRLGMETFGLLQLNDTRRDHFTPERIALAEWLCQHIAIALAQRQAQQQLERERAFLEAAIDTLPLPVAFLDIDCAATRVNAAARDWFREVGLSSMRDGELLLPRSYQPIDLLRWPAPRALGGEVIRAEEYLLRVPATGCEIPCLLYAAPIYLDDDVVAAVSIIEDITVLKEADQAKDEFLAVLSHELQTPLTNMLGWSVEGLRSDDPAFPRHALEVVHRNAVRQRRLVDEMLDMSRLIHRKIQLEVERLDVRAQAELAVENALPTATDRGLTLHMDIGDDPLPVLGDPHRLQQCIGNLVHNALKFTPAGGTVTVACRRAANQAVLTVTDTGRGIAPDALPTLFQVFHQVNRDERAGGLGLGLAVTRGIIELHGGAITADSAGENRGCTFTIILPLAPIGAGDATPERSPA